MQRLYSPHQFASLPPLSWDDIPRFTVLTGRNGVGKSHLLWLIATAFGVSGRPSNNQFPGGIQFDGKSINESRPDAIGYLPAIWSLEKASASIAMFKAVDELVENARTHARLERQSLEPVTRFFNMLSAPRRPRRLSGVSVDDLVALGEKLTHADVFAKLGQYTLVNGGSASLETLAEIFFAHINARVTAFVQGLSAEQVDADLGSPPWLRANDLLAHFDVVFRVEPPVDPRFEYLLRCRLPTGDMITPEELSSGEQAILMLVATVVASECLYLNEETGRSRLLLLDEPDAHVHTSVIKGYLAHLQRLVDQDFQVMMVTHRPETMLLCPPDSLVEMRRDGDQVEFEPVPPAKRPSLIARLAADSVAVLPSVRVVLVEAAADATFHQEIYERAKAIKALPAVPPLEFKPANRNGFGGKNMVPPQLAAMQSDGLTAFYRGLVDGDNETTSLPPGMLRLQRYAIENYWFDPLALYCTVVNDREVDARLGFAKAGGIGRGELMKLRDLDAPELQRIADLVLARFTGHVTDDLEREPVTLLRERGPVTLQYPRWVRTTPKKVFRRRVGAALDEAILRDAPGGPELAGLVPADLVDSYLVLTQRM